MNGTKFLSEIKFYNDYSKYNENLERKMTWTERAEDVMNMHRFNPKFEKAFQNPEFVSLFDFAENSLKNKLVLGSQRVLQFAGSPILKHNSRLYNCLTSYCDRVEVFQEAMYWLLSGCGVGLSFVKEHVAKLPSLSKRTRGTKTFVVPDSIEGWSDAVGVLISSYVDSGATFPEYSGYQVRFDYSLVRPKGSYISGGFKAPGPWGLKMSLESIEGLLERSLGLGTTRFRPIIAYDILMFVADSVLSGGVRRSATIALFSPDDEEMMNAKTGNWMVENPQRKRSNISALLVRGKTPRDLFDRMVRNSKEFGEPGFVFAESIDVVYNPCLIGSSLITTKSGVKTIKELSEMNLRDLKKVRVLTYNEETESLEYKKIKHALKTKLNTRTLNIKFSDGSELNSTPDHKIFVENKGWVEAINLSKDDVILSFSQDNSKYTKENESTILDNIDTNKWTNLIYEDIKDNPWNVDRMRSDLSEEEKELATKLFVEISDKVKIKTKKVISVEEDINFDVYDMSIEDNRNFFANGTLVHNCVEIGMIPRTRDGRSGWQGCNLCEINGGEMKDREIFLDACKAAAVIGTIQAAYTDFRYVSDVCKEIFDFEALLGVSITGFMNSPKILLNPEILKEGAEMVRKINRIVAKILGIRPAARSTCVKPSGNASVLLETTSGIHGEHSEMFFRLMQINKSEEISKYLFEKYPDLLEESVWSSTGADWALFVPIKAKDGSIFKKDLLGVKQLEMVKLVQQSWVEFGTDVDLCIEPYLRHNVSNTISVDDWDGVADYIWDNQKWLAGISLLSHTGDKIYNQAPFTEVLSPDRILDRYGNASMLVSGLIVDGLQYFDNNLWKACDYLLDSDKSLPLEGTRTQIILRKDWLKRAKRFGIRNFESLNDLVFCMKDVHLWHKWMKTERIMKNISIEDILCRIKPEYLEVDQLGAVACSGGACEIVYM